MDERRTASRHRSFLQGRIFYNNRRASVDCLIRDISDAGAKLQFSEAVTVPEAIELFIPNWDEIRRARVQRRIGNELGVTFGEDVQAPSSAPGMPAAQMSARLAKLESEIASLKRLVNELRAESRKAQGEVA
jgi:PilZ domain